MQLKASPTLDIQEHSVYNFTVGASLESFRTQDPEFSLNDFSRFKYGDGKIALEYATNIANILMDRVLNRERTYYICSSAYNNIPTAAASIVPYLIKILSRNNYQVEPFKISCHSFNEDYSRLNKKDRHSLLSKLSPRISLSDMSKIGHSPIVVIDDIQITGFHQKAIESLAQQLHIAEVAFCYAVSLTFQDKIDQSKIEWDMNHYYITDLDRLQEVMQGAYFMPNARICKFILSSEDAKLRHFVKGITTTQQKYLSELMRKDGYNQMESYKRAFSIFSSSISLR